MEYKEAAFLKDLAWEFLSRSGVKFKPTARGFECRCPVCHDSTSDPNKMRGAFIIEADQGEWLAYYKCLNGGCPSNRSRQINRLFETHAPDLFRKWEVFKGRKPGLVSGFRGAMSAKAAKMAEEEWRRKEAEARARIEQEEREKLEQDRQQLPFFIPLTMRPSHALQSMAWDEAVAYVKSRLIPEHVWRTWFVAYAGRYAGRLVIPFYRLNERPTYWQARALREGIEPKYKNRHGRKSLYNIDFVDWSEPVHVLEGAIDSVFVTNSFALNGITVRGDAFKEFPKDKIYMIQDNDPAGRDKAIKMLAEGYHVFCWGRLQQALKRKYGDHVDVPKDVNNLVTITGKTRWEHPDLLPFFTNTPNDESFLTT